VAFTVGILRLMDDREIEGVVAHELGHVRANIPPTRLPRNTRTRRAS
jgi:Zn-dependent protease with chaperone function